MRFRNYRNKYTKNKIIRSLEDIIDMPFGNIVDMEQELYNQYNQIGLPTNEELKSSPNVRFIESSINDEGIKIPSRWEAFNPMENVTQKAIMGNSSAKPFENLTIDNYGNETNIPQKFETKQSLWKKLAKGLSAITPFADDTTDMEMQEITPVLKQQTQNIQTNIPQVQQVTPLLAKDMNTDISENLNQEMEENVPIVQNPAINLQEDFSKELTTFPNIDNSKVQLSENVQEFINSLLESKKNRADIVKNPHEKISDTSEQQGQSQFSNNLKDYINELVGENIDYGFEGNKSLTSSQSDVPIYPENGVIKGGIANDLESNKDILQQSGGYIYPDKKSRDYNIIDESAIKYNNKKNTNRPDAQQMLEIGIYGVDSYDDNDQFKHIQDGSADLYNEKYKLVGNKTIPSDMKGIEFSKDSDFSKRISENSDFQQTVKDALEKNGGKMLDKIELDFSKDKNLNYSIGHGTLLNPKVTDDGYVEGVVYDKYDYDWWKLDKIIKDPKTSSYNNGAALLHYLNKLEYYYYFVPVRFKY